MRTGAAHKPRSRDSVVVRTTLRTLIQGSGSCTRASLRIHDEVRNLRTSFATSRSRVIELRRKQRLGSCISVLRQACTMMDTDKQPIAACLWQGLYNSPDPARLESINIIIGTAGCMSDILL